VFLCINPAAGTKVCKAKGKKIQCGVHEAVLALIKDMAVHEITSSAGIGLMLR
jgi:hypothetical protein